MNTITLGGKTVYDPPIDVGWVNHFTMHSGAARYGVGRFCMLRGDYDAIANDVVTVQLVMKADQGTGLTLTVVLAGAVPLSTAVGTSTAGDMVEVIVFDQRARQLSAASKAYNVQVDGFPVAGDDNRRYYPSTLLGGTTAWPWSGVISDMGLGSGQVKGTLPSWTPRNLIFDAVAQNRSLDDVAARLFMICGYDHQNNQVLLYDPGQQATGQAAMLTRAEPTRIGGRQTARNLNRLPGEYLVNFRAYSPTSPDPYAARAYTSSQSNDVGDGSYTQPLPVGEYVAAVAGDGSFPESSTLDSVAADMASRALAMQRLIPDEREFAGIWPFQPDGQVRGIRWISDRRGARTIVRMNNDQDFSPLDETRRAVEAVTNHLVAGLGSSNAAASPGGARMLYPPLPLPLEYAVMTGSWTPGTNYVTGNLSDEDGTNVDTTLGLTLALIWPPGDTPQYCPFTAGSVMAFLRFADQALVAGFNGLLVGYRQTPLCVNQYEVIYNASDDASAPRLEAGFLYFTNGRPTHI